MAKDPAFLFYPQDFIMGVIFFTDEEVGKYIRLLCAQHQQGGLIEKNIFNSVVKDSKLLREKFVESEDGFYNLRLMSEMEKRAIKSNNLSANAMQRWQKDKQKQCKSNAIASHRHMPTENENENENVKEDIYIKEDIYRKEDIYINTCDPNLIERVSKGLPNPSQRIKDKDKCETNLIPIEEHPLQVHIKKNCPNISKLKTQLTYAEAERLVVEFPNDGLQAVIEAMENYKLLAQKSISVNLTIRNWIRRNQNGTNRKNYTRGSVDINKWDRELKIARGEMPDLDAGAIK